MDHKMTMLGAQLLHMKVSLICGARLFCLGRDNHAQSTSIYWNILYPYCDQPSHVTVLGLKDVLKFPC